jgi:hypothetical protein
MNIGKLVKRHDEYFVRDLTTDQLHHATATQALRLGEYYSFEINEDDDAVDIVAAADALLAYGIQASTGSFYNTLKEEDPEASDADEADEAEAFFGTCELTGMRGSIVPCLYLDTYGNVVVVQAGEWLVHSVLGKLAGAF